MHICSHLYVLFIYLVFAQLDPRVDEEVDGVDEEVDEEVDGVEEEVNLF